MSAAVPVARGVSPRTLERPMAFTMSEFLYGSATAFLAYQPMGAATFVILIIVRPLFSGWDAPDLGSAIGGFLFFFVVAGMIGIAFSLCAWIAGSPFAYVLGRCLQTVQDERVHLVAFAGYGLAVGLATTIAFWLAMSGASGPVGDPRWSIWFAFPAAIAVPYGQHRAARQALGADAAAAMAAPARTEGDSDR